MNTFYFYFEGGVLVKNFTVKKRSTVKNCMVGLLCLYLRDILFEFLVEVEWNCTQNRCTYGEWLSIYF